MKKYFSFLMFAILLAGETSGQASDLIISEYGEGSSGNAKYIELYNGTGVSVTLNNYRVALYSNGSSTASNTANLSGTLANGATYVIANNSTDVPGANTYLSGPMSFNGDDAVAILKNISSTWTVIDVVGQIGTDPGSSWPVAGTAGATENRRLTRKATVCSPNANWATSAGTNATNSEWIVGGAYSNGAAIAGHTQTCTIPNAITTTAISANSYPVISGGQSISVGSGTINAKGVIWGLTAASIATLPVPGAAETEGRWHKAESGTSSFTAPLAGVRPGATIYYRAYYTTTSPADIILGDVKSYVVPDKGTSLAFWNFGPDGDGYTLTPNSMLPLATLTPATGTGSYDANGKDGFIYNGAVRGQAMTWDDVTAPASTDFVIHLNTTGYQDLHVRADYLAQAGGTYTLAYSTNGSSYTNITTAGAIPTNMTVAGDENYNWGTVYHDLSSVTVLENAADIYLRFTLNTGIADQFQIDNIEIYGTAQVPEINITGNGVSIADGDMTPAIGDHTDFGDVCVSGGSVIRTFTIQNTGTGPLNLTGASPYVSISGAGFSLTTDPATPVPAGGFTTFQVSFDPSLAGTSNGSISISSNDANENPYNFNITGTGIAVATASVAIAANPSGAICAGTSVTFTATASGLGGGTASYQWKLNGANVGTNSIIYTTAGLANGDIVLCEINVLNGCVTSATASSAGITMTVNPLPANPAGSITLSANPSCGPATLSFPAALAPLVNYWQTTPGVITANPTSVNYNLNASGTMYVRTQNTTTGCWSAGTINTGAVTIHSPILLTTQPPNRSVTSPVGTTFGVTATGTGISYQWQIDTGAGWTNISNGGIYSGANTATLTLASTSADMDSYSYRCIISGTAPCAPVTSNAGTLAVAAGPCLNEGFAAGTTAPAGWVFTAIGGTYTTATNFGLASPSLQFDNTNDRVTTAIAASTASQLSFWVKGQGTAASSALLIEGWNGTGFVTIQNLNNLPTTGTIITYSAATTPALPPGLSQFRFTYTDNGGNIALDDVQVLCNPGCTPGQAISAFTPASGPAGTVVTITGTGFTGATAVRFGGVNAPVYTVVNATTITAEVPANAVTGKVSVVVAGCAAISATNFTILSQNANCGSSSGSGPASDLFISEVYDAEVGSLSYVEVFNGTAATVSLANYTIRIRTGTSTDNDFPMSGSLASGATYILRIGTGTICSGISVNDNETTAAGFNGNDQVFLLKNGNDLDYIPNPNSTFAGGTGSNAPGFSQNRNASVTAPSATYIASQWANTVAENCDNLGIAPYAVTTKNVHITSHPSDVNCNAEITFSVSATSTPGPINYVWYYTAPGAVGWSLVSAFPAALQLTVAGSGTNSITITGNTAVLKNYQFYCEIGGGGAGQCIRSSNAAGYFYNSEPFYRTIAGGEWTNPAIWQMSGTENGAYVAACQYPIAINNDKVIIMPGHAVTLNTDITIDWLNINTGGALEIGSSSLLSFNNGNAAGADLEINGTLTDGGSSGNGVDFINGSGSAWSIASGATLVRTNTSSSASYRDNYQGGMANIDAGANWIIRGSSSVDVTFTTTATAASAQSFPSATYYPNLIIESRSGNWNPGSTATSSRFSGSSNFATIKGNLDIGGTGAGTVTVYNENTNVNAMLINGDVIIRAGNTLTNNGNVAGTGFNIKGNLTVDGTLISNGGNANAGILGFSGTATQTISGNGVLEPKDVEIANSAVSGNVINNKNFAIRGTLSFGNTGKLSLGTGNITLSSGPAQTAGVGVIPATASILYPGIGRFIVERYISYTRKWQLLSVPANTTQSIFESWQESGNYTPGYGIKITGPGAINGLDAPSSTSSSMKYQSGTGHNFLGITGTNTPNSLNTDAGRGYYIFIYGDRSSGAGTPAGPPTTIRTTGKLFIGNNVAGEAPATINLPATINENISIGNPFASAVNFATLKTASSNLAFNYKVWDPSQGGSYNAGIYQTITGPTGWIATPGSGSIYNEPGKNYSDIQSGQAFFVQAAATGIVNIPFAENIKTGGSRLANRGNNEPASVDPLTISMLSSFIYNNSNGNIMDGNRVVFDAIYSNSVDEHDAVKLMNDGLNFGINKQGSILAVEARLPLSVTDTIYFQLANILTGNYQLRFAVQNINQPLIQAELIDRFLGSRTPVSLTDSSFINFSATANTASAAVNRFYLVFKPVSIVPVTITGIWASRIQNKTADVNWSVENEINMSSYEIERSTNGNSFTRVGEQSILYNGAGRQYLFNDATAPYNLLYYRIKAISNTGQVQYSPIAKVAEEKTGLSFKIYPNPATGNQVNIQLTGIGTAALYQLALYDAQGKLVHTESIKPIAGNSSISLHPQSELAAGTYRLQVYSTEKTVTLPVIIK